MAQDSPAKVRTLAECEEDVEHGLRFSGAALLEIKNGKLYKETHKAWADYCTERWGMTSRSADRQIQQAVAAAALPSGSPIPSQRSLAPPSKSETRASHSTEPPKVIEATGRAVPTKHLDGLEPTPIPEPDATVAAPPTPTRAAPDQAPPGDESVGATMTTAPEPPADSDGADLTNGPEPEGSDPTGQTGGSPIGEVASETTDPPADVPKDRGPRTMKEWLLQSAVSSVEELQDAGPGSILPNAAQRIALAAGFILITVAQYEQYQKAMRENAEHKMDAPTEPPPSTRVRRPPVVARPQPLRREIVEPNFKGGKK